MKKKVNKKVATKRKATRKKAVKRQVSKLEEHPEGSIVCERVPFRFQERMLETWKVFNRPNNFEVTIQCTRGLCQIVHQQVLANTPQDINYAEEHGINIPDEEVLFGDVVEEE